MGAHPPLLGPLGAAAPSLTERAIQAVRAAIRAGSMVPGELYSVNQLAVELGVSRSPVRDALLRLEETGMLKFERYKGFRLQLPGAAELAQIFAVRVSLEIPAARQAAVLATDEQVKALERACSALRSAAAADVEPEFMLQDQKLHGLLLDVAGNEYARKVVDNIRDATRLVGASTVENFRSLPEIYAEHVPIVEAVVARDAGAAASAMYRHLRQTGQLLLRKSVGLGRADAEEESCRLWDRFVEFPEAPRES
jgi:DNA-binding GntR family transcriptional regulator